MKNGESEDGAKKVTDIDALKGNVEMAVVEFIERWMPMPKFDIGVEVMDVWQLRDALGLRATIDWGDPWPTAEQLLLAHGFRWHSLGGSRVMFLREKDDYKPDDGWEEVESEESLK